MRYVYFLRYGGAVKVGCSMHPTTRKIEVMLQRSAVPECELIGVVRGGFNKERTALAKMRELYGPPLIGKEWFTVPETFDPKTIVKGYFLGDAAISKLRREPRPKTRNLMAVVVDPKLLKELRSEWKTGQKFWYGFVHDVLTAGLASIRSNKRRAA